MAKVLLFNDQDLKSFFSNHKNHRVNLGKVVNVNTLQQKLKKHCTKASKVGKTQERFQLIFDDNKQMNTQIAMLNMFQEIIIIEKNENTIEFIVIILPLQ